MVKLSFHIAHLFIYWSPIQILHHLLSKSQLNNHFLIQILIQKVILDLIADAFLIKKMLIFYRLISSNQDKTGDNMYESLSHLTIGCLWIFTFCVDMWSVKAPSIETSMESTLHRIPSIVKFCVESIIDIKNQLLKKNCFTILLYNCSKFTFLSQKQKFGKSKGC